MFYKQSICPELHKLIFKRILPAPTKRFSGIGDAAIPDDIRTDCEDDDGRLEGNWGTPLLSPKMFVNPARISILVNAENVDPSESMSMWFADCEFDSSMDSEY